jgi:hypothetical protein
MSVLSVASPFAGVAASSSARLEATLVHGFMAIPSRWTDDYNRRKLEFLRSVVG